MRQLCHRAKYLCPELVLARRYMQTCNVTLDFLPRPATYIKGGGVARRYYLQGVNILDRPRQWNIDTLCTWGRRNAGATISDKTLQVFE